MILGVRRAVTGLAVGLVVSLGVAPVAPASAETPSPTPIVATATPSAGEIDLPDVELDNSRQVWALGGAGAVALIAAAVVFLRRR